MAEDQRPDRRSRLRDAIASKLREKAPAEVPEETAAPTHPAPTPRRTPPKSEPVSALDTAKHILSTQIALTGPKLTDYAVMCRQLATLIDVGIPLLRALRILSERTQHPRLRQVMREVAGDVEQGSPLAAALSRHPKVIPELIINIVRIGEEGGILEESLRRLAEIYERRAQVKSRIKGAMAYPIAAVCVAVGVLLLIFAYAIPVFEEVYTQKEGVELPDITQQVIAVSNFVRHQWMFYIPGVIVLIILAVGYGRTATGRYIYDRLRLKLPVIGQLNMKISVARFSRTLSNLLSAGIPLIEALSSTAKSSDNVVLATALMETRAAVEEGEKMEETLREARVMPPMVIDMIAIGDESGTLDVMLGRMADAYEDEVDAGVRGLVALIEPLLIIFLGVAVIIIALAILLPYWNIGEIVE